MPDSTHAYLTEKDNPEEIQRLKDSADKIGKEILALSGAQQQKEVLPSSKADAVGKGIIDLANRKQEQQDAIGVLKQAFSLAGPGRGESKPMAYSTAGTGRIGGPVELGTDIYKFLFTRQVDPESQVQKHLPYPQTLPNMISGIASKLEEKGIPGLDMFIKGRVNVKIPTMIPNGSPKEMLAAAAQGKSMPPTKQINVDVADFTNDPFIVDSVAHAAGKLTAELGREAAQTAVGRALTEKGGTVALRTLAATEASTETVTRALKRAILPGAEVSVKPAVMGEALSAWKEARTLSKESGVALNPIAVYKDIRDAGRALWGRGADAVEGIVWKQFPEKMRDFLRVNFATGPARTSEQYWQSLRRIYIQKELTAFDLKTRANVLTDLTPERNLAANRFLNPDTPWDLPKLPRDLLSEEQLAALEAMKHEVEVVVNAKVERGLTHPETAKEFIHGYLYRMFSDAEFLKAGGEPATKPLRIYDSYVRKNAYGGVVPLSRDEINSLMAARGTSKEAALEPIEELKGIVTGGKRRKIGTEWITEEDGTRRQVDRFSHEAYPVKFQTKGEMDEFMRRYRQAYGDKAKLVGKRFEPMPKELIDELNSMIGPTERLYQTLSRLRMDVAKHDFFDLVSKDERFAAATLDEAPKMNWKTLPTSRGLGPLSGKTVRPDVYRDIQEFNSEMLSDGVKIWRSFLARWKAGKTIFSLRTHSRNFLGNASFAHMADNLPPWFGGLTNHRYYADWVKALTQKNEMLREMIKNGIHGTQWADVELDAARGLVADGTTEGAASGLKKFLIHLDTVEHRGTKTLASEAAKLYNLEDAIYRGATYIKARTAWGMTEEQATSYVNRYFQNYADVGDAFRRLANSPLGGPFSRFQAEAIRIFYNGIKTRPIKTATAVAWPMIVTQIARSTLNISDEEYQLMQHRGPMAMPIPWRDSDGNVDTLSMDYISPWGTTLGGILGTQYNRDEDVQRWMDVVGPFVLQNPTVTIPMGMMLGIDPFSGREIKQTGMSKLESKVDFGAEQLSPGLLHPAHMLPGPARLAGLGQYKPIGREGQKIVDTVKGKRYYTGEERSGLRTAVDVLMGLNPIPVDPIVEEDKSRRIAGGIQKDISMTRSRLEKGVKRGVENLDTAVKTFRREKSITGKDQLYYEKLATMARIVTLSRRGNSAAVRGAIAKERERLAKIEEAMKKPEDALTKRHPTFLKR